MSSVENADIKTRVHETLQTLPDNASWEDVMYRIYVRQKIENGLKDVTDENALSVEEVRKRFGLPE
jgi:hypothetical protein